MIDEQRATDNPENPPPPKSRAAFWKELAILVTVAVVVSVVVRTFLVQTFWIPSGSMENTLQIQDRVLVNKIVYDFRDPERGEILVFEAPEAWRAISAEKEYIKRVIAVGGDRVVCCDDAGRISVNGTPLDEPYIHRNEAGIVDPASRNIFDVVIPNGRLWVMGDHRSASSDSRENFCRFLRIDDGWTDEAVARAAVDAAVVAATIPVDSVVGKAFVLFWPLSRFTWLTVPDTFDNIAAPGSDPRPQPGLEEIKDLCRTPASLGG